LNLLFISPYTPTPIRTRPYNLLRALKRSGVQVTLATVWEDEAERQALDELADQGIEIIAEALTRRQIAVNLARAIPHSDPLQAHYSWQPTLANKIAVKLTAHHSCCDIIHIEHLRGAQYGLFLQQQLVQLNKKTVPIVWDSVDNISSLFEQAARKSRNPFGRWVTRLELPRTRCYERMLVSRFERTLVTSPLDRQAFSSLCQDGAGCERVEVLTNGVDLEYFAPDGRLREPETIIFSGKLSYHANISSALYLIQQVMPIVWSQRSNVRVWLVGKDPHPSLAGLAQNDQRVIVTGTVPDLRSFLRQAWVAAAPLTYGAGVQNKVLEAMACGTPVVATRQAVSALGADCGQDVLVGDQPEELAKALLKLMQDTDLHQQLSERGRRYVEHNHDWNKIAARALMIYEDVIRTSGNGKLAA
jgi:glycosyltransferase involved in cell wall biosynthesis